MPLGGLLPYDNGPMDIGQILRGQIGLGDSMPQESGGGGVMPGPAPQQGGGTIQQLAALLPQFLTAFGAGQAVRQRDPGALSGIIENFLQGQEQRRRGRLAEDAQRLREQREGRLSEFAEKKYQQDIAESQARSAATLRDDERASETQRQGLFNTIEDNARLTFADRMPEGAALEEYISQQANRVGQGDSQSVRAMLMGLATLMSRQPEVPLITLEPGKAAPATVPKGAVVRNAPQPREGPRPEVRTTTDEEGNIYEYVLDPNKREIPGTRRKTGSRPKPAAKGSDAIDQIINEAIGGGRGSAPVSAKPAGATGAITVTAPNGKTYTFKSPAEADAFKRAAGIR